MAKYQLIITVKEYDRVRIESDTPLTDEEMEEIQYQGIDGIPERFSIEQGSKDGEYPSDVQIHDIEDDEDEEETQRRDEKNGLYPDRWDYAN